MRLTFGGMIKEVNIFYMGKRPRYYEDQIFKVNLIEGLTSEHHEELEYTSVCEFELESDDFNLN